MQCSSGKTFEFEMDCSIEGILSISGLIDCSNNNFKCVVFVKEIVSDFWENASN